MKQTEKLYVYHEEYKKDYNDWFYTIIYYNFYTIEIMNKNEEKIH